MENLLIVSILFAIVGAFAARYYADTRCERSMLAMMVDYADAERAAAQDAAQDAIADAKDALADAKRERDMLAFAYECKDATRRTQDAERAERERAERAERERAIAIAEIKAQLERSKRERIERAASADAERVKEVVNGVVASKRYARAIETLAARRGKGVDSVRLANAIAYLAACVRRINDDEALSVMAIADAERAIEVIYDETQRMDDIEDIPTF